MKKQDGDKPYEYWIKIDLSSVSSDNFLLYKFPLLFYTDELSSAKAKKATDSKTTAEVVMELESRILSTKTAEGRKELCNAFNKNKMGYE